MNSQPLTRTSMALDGFTIEALNELSQKWEVSKAEIIRKAVRLLKAQADHETALPTPLEAIDWLENGGAMLKEDAEQYKAELKEERNAKQYWWEQA